MAYVDVTDHDKSLTFMIQQEAQNLQQKVAVPKAEWLITITKLSCHVGDFKRNRF